MNKTQAEQLTNDVLILDVLLRLKTLETILVSKGLITQAEYDAATEEISRAVPRNEKSTKPPHDFPRARAYQGVRCCRRIG